MNKDNARDYLPLVQALADGKVIQMKNAYGGWTDMTSLGTYVDPSEYRIKPEPRELWVMFTPDGVPYEATDNAPGYVMKDLDGKAGYCKRYREIIE